MVTYRHTEAGYEIRNPSGCSHSWEEPNWANKIVDPLSDMSIASITDIEVTFNDFNTNAVTVAFSTDVSAPVVVEVNYGETPAYGFTEPAVQVGPDRFAATFNVPTATFHYLCVVDAEDSGDNEFTILIPDEIVVFASSDVIPPSGSAEITAKVMSGGTPVPGCEVKFEVENKGNKSSGTFNPGTKTTDAAGTATSKYTPTKPGKAMLVVSCGNLEKKFTIKVNGGGARRGPTPK